MKKIFFALVLLFGGIMFAQNTSISISPKTFKHTVLLKAKVLEETNITVEFVQSDKIVKTIQFKSVMNEAFKINLKDLEQNIATVVNIYDTNNNLIFTDRIIKSLKY